MLDIKFLRENSEVVKKNLEKREKYDTSIVDKVLELDVNWRAAKVELDSLKGKKNSESKKIAGIKKTGGDIKSQLDLIKEISTKLEVQEKVVKELIDSRDKLLVNIPNMLDESVPKGASDEDNVEIRFNGEKPVFDFKIRNHQELCEMNNWYDLDTAAVHSGARFYYLKGDLVLLQLAIYNFVFSKMTQKGYTPIEVPPMLRTEAIGRSVSLDAFEEDLYKIEGEDLHLIATAEHALALIHADKTLNYRDLPIKYAGISPSFRKEAGVTKDEKGIFRVHNFNKIEQFVFSTPEQADEILDELTANAEEVFKDLEIHFRVVNICSGDIGSFAAKKFDVEAWLPGQNNYREMVSASNYRDYGARRLNVKFQDQKNNLRLCNTLNSTAIALTRGMIALIETHQREDGSVYIPRVLRPFLGNREFIGGKN